MPLSFQNPAHAGVDPVLLPHPSFGLSVFFLFHFREREDVGKQVSGEKTVTLGLDTGAVWDTNAAKKKVT